VSWHFMTDGYTEVTETFIKLNCFLHFDLREDGDQQSQTSSQSNTQTLRWNPFLIKVYFIVITGQLSTCIGVGQCMGTKY
jgi:hypothetical protein